MLPMRSKARIYALFAPIIFAYYFFLHLSLPLSLVMHRKSCRCSSGTAWTCRSIVHFIRSAIYSGGRTRNAINRSTVSLKTALSGRVPYAEVATFAPNASHITGTKHTGL